MKKTKKNQNMPDQSFSNNETANRASLNIKKNETGRPDRYIDSNLNQSRDTRQRYDDHTGTVENGIG